MSKSFKGIIILCEGRTDASYIRRLLSHSDYTDYKKIISSMKKPLDSFFGNYLKKFDYESERILKRPLLPILMRRNKGQKDDFAIIYAMDGLNKTANYKYVIDKYKKLINSTNSDFGGSDDLPNINLSLVFVCDMDELTENDRIDYFKTNYSSQIPELNSITNQSTLIKCSDFTSTGIHIFKHPDNETGNLEDILLEFVSGNSLISNARTFLEENNFSRASEALTQSDLKKSIIGVSGQLEKSGTDNANIISNSSLFAGNLHLESESVRLINFIKEAQKTIY